MSRQKVVQRRHQFRLVICGHKAVEAGAVCVLLMVQGVCTFAADTLIHASHYPGAYTEAALTGIGAFVFSLVISYTPVGKRIDHLADAFLDGHIVK